MCAKGQLMVICCCVLGLACQAMNLDQETISIVVLSEHKGRDFGYIVLPLAYSWTLQTLL